MTCPLVLLALDGLHYGCFTAATHHQLVLARHDAHTVAAGIPPLKLITAEGDCDLLTLSSLDTDTLVGTECLDGTTFVIHAAQINLYDFFTIALTLIGEC